LIIGILFEGNEGGITSEFSLMKVEPVVGVTACGLRFEEPLLFGRRVRLILPELEKDGREGDEGAEEFAGEFDAGVLGGH
jgi:hypothetical protein